MSQSLGEKKKLCMSRVLRTGKACLARSCSPRLFRLDRCRRADRRRPRCVAGGARQGVARTTASSRLMHVLLLPLDRFHGNPSAPTTALGSGGLIYDGAWAMPAPARTSTGGHIYGAQSQPASGRVVTGAAEALPHARV
jgi:hypothetical protein